MGKKESDYQKYVLDKIRRMYPGCIILKNDAGYLQGIPDWTIFYKSKWVMLEIKKSKDANIQPNQEYYIHLVRSLSPDNYAAFLYPENEEEVLNGIQQTFRS